MTGPAFWKIDLAVSRMFPLSGTQNVELRLEGFNVTNHFNWGQPVVEPVVLDVRTYPVDERRSAHPAVRD